MARGKIVASKSTWIQRHNERPIQQPTNLRILGVTGGWMLPFPGSTRRSPGVESFIRAASMDCVFPPAIYPIHAPILSFDMLWYGQRGGGNQRFGFFRTEVSKRSHRGTPSSRQWTTPASGIPPPPNRQHSFHFKQTGGPPHRGRRCAA